MKRDQLFVGRAQQYSTSARDSRVDELLSQDEEKIR
jgi:hypothetical protein